VKREHQFVAIGHDAGLDSLGDVFVDELARVFLLVVRGSLSPTDAARMGQVRMRRLVGARSLGIVRPGPALAPVE